MRALAVSVRFRKRLVDHMAEGRWLLHTLRTDIAEREHTVREMEKRADSAADSGRRDLADQITRQANKQEDYLDDLRALHTALQDSVEGIEAELK